jgi:peptidoglycan/xylan/chitin deacetylase (PgdA/CDA1 family)
MRMAGKRLRNKWGAIIWILFGSGLLFQSSCATLSIAPRPTEPATLEEKPAEPTIFQSEDYILYLLQGDETPAFLAQRFLGDPKRSWVIEEANEGVPFEKDQMIVIPLKEYNKGGLTVNGYQLVPILCYYRFAEDCKSPLCTPANIFDLQMRYLKDHGYRVITLGDLLGFLRYRHALPKRSVVITIDDGYKSAYDIAYPILRGYGFMATFFIYTDFIGASKNAITWDQLREMKADGFEVGSQTLSHCDLTKKGTEEDDQAHAARIRRELVVSKRILDKELNQDTIYLAFPYGSYDQRVLNICNEVGYKIGLSLKRGGNPFFADPLALKRDQILKKYMDSFVTSVKTFHESSLK